MGEFDAAAGDTEISDRSSLRTGQHQPTEPTNNTMVDMRRSLRSNLYLIPIASSCSMHHHDEIRICSGLITDAIIRNDEGRARRQ